MNNSKEYDDLLQRKQELLREQDMYAANRNDAKKHFEAIDFNQDDKAIVQMCQSIYEDGAQGDKKILNLLIEACELMDKQEERIRQLEEEADLEYLDKMNKCEDELMEVQHHLRTLDS